MNEELIERENPVRDTGRIKKIKTGGKMKRMITYITPGKFSIFIILLTILSFQEVKPQQDPIDQYPGIPFIAYPDRRAPQMLPVNFDQMEQMGTYGIVSADVLTINRHYLDTFTVHNIKVLPQFWEDTTNSQNIIERYTNSHYTVWEAEGTNSEDGDATLYHSTHTTTETDTVTYVKTLSSVQNGEVIISGPGYPQNVTYNYPEHKDTVGYIIEYRMKIDSTHQILPPDYSTNTVCTIQVTNSNNDGSNETTVVEKEVKVSDFNGWDNWTIIDTTYRFDSTNSVEELRFQGSRLLPKAIAQCVQFKVVWRGLTYLNLYVDRVRVYDDKGNHIVNDPEYQSLVATLVENNINNHTIVGWYGTDEPFSIDNYEPYRVVDHIIDSVSRHNNYPIRLQAGMTGAKYGGIVEPGTNYVMAQDLYVLDEFWKRAKPKNIQVNSYNYFFPYGPNGIHDPDYVEKDIDVAINTYLNRVNDYDTSFEFSIQTGPGIITVIPHTPAQEQVPSSITLQFPK
jgi:hypothetical protein